MSTPIADSTGHAAGGIGAFTILFDPHCPLCRAARRWLESRAQLVPLGFLPAGSATARRLFPGLDHAATLRDITVIADTGEVYVGDGAWLACLWALADYRGLADRLARPDLLPVARRVIAAAARVRERTRGRLAESASISGAGEIANIAATGPSKITDTAAGAGEIADSAAGEAGYGGDDDRPDCAEDRCR